MSTTAVNNTSPGAKRSSIYILDDFNESTTVGDLIVYAVGGELREAFILGFTPKGIIISTQNGKWKPSAALHDARIYKRWLSFKVIDKNRPLPETLKPLLYHHQMNLERRGIT